MLASRWEGVEVSPAPAPAPVPLRLRPRCERDKDRNLSVLREWFSLPDIDIDPDFQLLLLSAGLDVPLTLPACAPK